MRVAFLIAFAILLAMLLKNWMSKRSSYATDADWAVYGTMGCGWTRKQIDELKSKNVRYEFVDCTNDGACGDIHAFPTNKKPDGTMVTGFIEAN